MNCEQAKILLSGLVDAERIVSHRFALKDIEAAVEAMALTERNKVIINP